MFATTVVAASEPAIPAEAAFSPERSQRQATMPVSVISDAVLERSFLCFLAALAVYMLLFSRVRLLWFDELLSWYTEQASTAHELLRIQATAPVSLDPAFYHLLGHWSLAAGMSDAMGVRLPSLLGSIVLLFTVYFFTRGLAGRCAAAFTVCGLLAAESFHMVEARPYGIILGAAGTALLCWQHIVRNNHRRLAVTGLFCALLLANSVHYFGVLLAMPFLAVQAVLTYRNRRLDVAVWAALLGSYIAVAAWLPFLHGAKSYKLHYYTRVQFHDLLWAYTLPLDGILHIHSVLADTALWLCLMVLLGSGLYAGWRRLRTPSSQAAEWGAVAVMMLLPFFGLAMSIATAGAFEARYVLEFTIAVAIAVGCGMTFLLRNRGARIAFIALAMLVVMVVFARNARENKRQILALDQCARIIPPAGPVTATSEENFLQLTHYFPVLPSGAALPLVWVADMGRETRFNGTDNVDRTMTNLGRWKALPVVSYSPVLRQNTPAVLLNAKGARPPGWLARQLRQDGANLIDIGSGGNCTVSLARPARP